MKPKYVVFKLLEPDEKAFNLLMNEFDEQREVIGKLKIEERIGHLDPEIEDKLLFPALNNTKGVTS